MTTNRSTLTAAVGLRTGLPREEAEEAVGAVIGALRRAVLRGERVEIRGLLTMEPAVRKARRSYNFATGEPFRMEARRTVRIRLSRTLYKRLAQKPVEG